jgi:hypothetical protein
MFSCYTKLSRTRKVFVENLQYIMSFPLLCIYSDTVVSVMSMRDIVVASPIVIFVRELNLSCLSGESCWDVWVGLMVTFCNGAWLDSDIGDV